MNEEISSKEKIENELKALADVVIDCYLDFKKRGLIDKNGNFINQSKESPGVSPRQVILKLKQFPHGDAKPFCEFFQSFDCATFLWKGKLKVADMLSAHT